MERWAGRPALVTGASSGIGAAICVALANHGMKVVGCARSVQKIQDLQKLVTSSRGSITGVKCDLRNESEIMSVINYCRQNGGIDVCINSAGLVNVAPLLSGETEKWKEMVDVNIIALSIFTREAYKSMKERNVTDGHIIHVSSWVAHYMMDSPPSHFYAGTKQMVKALLLGLRNEIRATGTHIRVSEISPGIVDTNLTTKMGGPQLAEFVRSALKNLRPEDVAQSVVHMLQAPPHVETYEVILLPTEQYDTAFINGGKAVLKEGV